MPHWGLFVQSDGAVCIRPGALLSNEVAKDKTVPQGGLAGANKDRPSEDGTSKDKSVKFAVFATGVRMGWEVAKKRFVEFTAGEAGIDDLGINADGDGAETLGMKKADELARVAFPKGKESRHAESRKSFFAIGTQVFEKDVTESHLANAPVVKPVQDLLHARFIGGIQAPRRDAYFVHGQTDGFGLELQKFAANTVHADAFVAFGDGGQKGRGAELLLPDERVKRHSAVFAAAPAEEDGLGCGHENSPLQAPGR